ncbi:hypothetical protein DPMN_166188 [Dreissena polymorpha]|uniref:Uncharacterized protein n=1 Tax=Dreissena polymorpha TaxID=45954 RepID=A0A9D4IXN5_DREPO|nr:hypothetical protein DPMN_166188 [Dreissena polymorpha]
MDVSTEMSKIVVNSTTNTSANTTINGKNQEKTAASSIRDHSCQRMVPLAQSTE